MSNFSLVFWILKISRWLPQMLTLQWNKNTHFEAYERALRLTKRFSWCKKKANVKNETGRNAARFLIIELKTTSVSFSKENLSNRIKEENEVKSEDDASRFHNNLELNHDNSRLPSDVVHGCTCRYNWLVFVVSRLCAVNGPRNIKTRCWVFETTVNIEKQHLASAWEPEEGQLCVCPYIIGEESSTDDF